VLDSRSGFGGALAVATYLHVAPDAARHVDAARAILDDTAAHDPEVADVEFSDTSLDGPATRRPGRAASDISPGHHPGHPPDRHLAHITKPAVSPASQGSVGRPRGSVVRS
jgi:hypothetical protein